MTRLRISTAFVTMILAATILVGASLGYITRKGWETQKATSRTQLEAKVIEFLATTDVKGVWDGTVEIVETYDNKPSGTVVVIKYTTVNAGHPGFYLEAIEHHIALITLNNKVTSAFCVHGDFHDDGIWDLLNQRWIRESLDSGTFSLEEEKAFNIAREAFAKTHAQPVFREGITRNSPDTFLVRIWYLTPLANYPEGAFIFTYCAFYDVNVTSEMVSRSNEDPMGWTAKFIGKEPVMSKEQARQTYLLLIDKTPSKNYYIFEEQKPVIPEVSEFNDHFSVSATFRDYAVNCIDPKITISYTIFKNGTSVLERVTQVGFQTFP